MPQAPVVVDLLGEERGGDGEHAGKLAGEGGGGGEAGRGQLDRGDGLWWGAVGWALEMREWGGWGQLRMEGKA